MTNNHFGKITVTTGWAVSSTKRTLTKSFSATVTLLGFLEQLCPTMRAVLPFSTLNTADHTYSECTYIENTANCNVHVHTYYIYKIQKHFNENRHYDFQKGKKQEKYPAG